MSKRYRIVSAPRFITFIVICTLLVIYTISTLVGFYTADGLTLVSYNKVLVQPGDTLWGIASDCVSGESKTDVRQVMYDIRDINNMTGSSLQAGQVILVPEYI